MIWMFIHLQPNIIQTPLKLTQTAEKFNHTQKKIFQKGL